MSSNKLNGNGNYAVPIAESTQIEGNFGSPITK